jgi:hypothetical protein
MHAYIYTCASQTITVCNVTSSHELFVRNYRLKVMIYIHTYIHTYIHAYMHIYMRVTYNCSQSHRRLVVRKYRLKSDSIHTYIHTYIHACTYTCASQTSTVYSVASSEGLGWRNVVTKMRIYIHTYKMIIYIHTYARNCLCANVVTKMIIYIHTYIYTSMHIYMRVTDKYGL